MLKLKLAITTVAVVLLSLAVTVAQSPIRTLTLGPDHIGLVKTAQGITTRLSFAEPVKELICGDLYDPNTGRGTFVVQRGDNDVFLKPITSRGTSNLFVKTGEKGEHVFSFDLLVVPLPESYRVVNVTGAGGNAVLRAPQNGEQPEDGASSNSRAKQQGEEIIRNARQQADRIIKQAEQRALEINRQAGERAAEVERQTAQHAEQEIERRFVRALMIGLREAKINRPRVVAKHVSLTLDPRVLSFDDKSYLRYAIQNNGKSDFTFGSISLEVHTGKETKTIPAEVIQSKSEKTVQPGESLSGVIVFDFRLIGERDKLSLSMRGEDSAEIARVSITP